MDEIQLFLFEFKVLNDVPIDEARFIQLHNGNYKLVINQFPRSKMILPVAMSDQIEELYLMALGLDSLPENIGHYKNLKVLNLEYNLIDSMPNEVSELNKLRVLSLGYNYFRVFPGVITLLDSLEELHFDHNKLQSLPEEIYQIENLHTLVLFGNPISSLPESITGMKKIKELDVRWNGMDQMSKSTLKVLRRVKWKKRKITSKAGIMTP